jgi:hypothetical protein
MSAAAAGTRKHPGHRIGAVRQVESLHPEAAGKPQARGIEITAEHFAAGGAEGLAGQQTDQSKPDDDELLAQRRLSQAHALQTDRADHREDRGLVAHFAGNSRAQRAGHAHNFGVGAVGNHTLANAELRNAGTDGEHRSDIAVA